MTNGNEEETQDLQITRIIAAPLGTLWNSWTNCDELKRWWGPKGYKSPDCRIDLRVGGRFIFAMQAPAELGGRVSYTAGEYERIMPGRSLEFTQYISDKDGNRIEPAQAGLPADFPKEMHTVVSFEAKGSMDQLITELSLTISGWPKGPAFEQSLQGWTQSLDKLIEMVTRKQT